MESAPVPAAAAFGRALRRGTAIIGARSPVVMPDGRRAAPAARFGRALRRRKCRPDAVIWPPPGARRIGPAGRAAAVELRAAGRETALEADQVVDVEYRRGRRAVAVGPQVAGRESCLEADEVVDVEQRQAGGVIAVGVAVGGG